MAYRHSNDNLTLLQLNALVQDAIRLSMPDTYWVEAEIASCHENRGHLYLELIQKDEHTHTPVARASARCWANTWSRLGYQFQSITGSPLSQGMKVLLAVTPQFHPAYGFSWIVSNIDATYTLGDMARRRQEIIRTLKAEGIFDLQHELSLPLFCQDIAVISSATAAGYGDFCDQLASNTHGYHFSTTLFQATMQGEQVEQSIINQLEQIYMLHESQQQTFDCVVIIRGGGATSDLSGFDTLALAEHVANFPLPVITGIGHERDESVLDMISFAPVKTPTAAAEYLIAHLAEVEDIITSASERIRHVATSTIERERIRLTSYASRIPTLFSLYMSRENSRLDSMMLSLNNAISQRFTHERHRLDMLAQRASALDPQRILSRGYSITSVRGHVVTDPAEISEGDILDIRLAKGTIRASAEASPPALPRREGAS